MQNAVEIRDEGEEVTVSATHYVKWECTEDFKRWTYDMAAAMSKVTFESFGNPLIIRC